MSHVELIITHLYFSRNNNNCVCLLSMLPIIYILYVACKIVFLPWALFSNSVTIITGEPPSDPSVGFLPPNNITSGQGFVTFSIYTSRGVSSLARIDAEASIIFDENEPINTPPIFNTVNLY